MTPSASPLPESAFDESLAFVMSQEKGYSDDPSDPGGATNMGIIQRTYDAFRRDSGVPTRSVIDITPREVREIYWGGYWRPAGCDSIASLKPDLALVAFDCAVNQGEGESRLCLQRALGVTADGLIGPSTMSAVAACAEPSAVTAFLIERARVYRATVAAHPALAKFLPGWLARLRWCARATGTPIAPAFAP